MNTCVICNKQFDPYRPTNRYCSHRCSKVAWAKRARELRKLRPEKTRAEFKRWYATRMAKSSKEERHEMRTKERERYYRKRDLVFGHYGRHCACCGEATPEFLTIDHVNNNGAEHRRTDAKGSLYYWLVKQGFPSGFQTLCWNCNCAKGKYGYCPHQRAQKEMTA